MNDFEKRKVPLEISAESFRRDGHKLIDEITDFLSSIEDRKVTSGESPKEIRSLLGNQSLPEKGTDVSSLMDETTRLLIEHSLYNGHPQFYGYITSSAAPIGVLGDLLAASVNPNVGSFMLSPIATEIEAQTVRWIAEFIGYPPSCGGILVSGGNMANFVCFIAARKAKSTWDVRASGVMSETKRPRIYASTETHTWVQKAADLFGFGTDAIRWIPVDASMRMKTQDLRNRIHEDRTKGELPMMVIGTAGTVSTGAIDSLIEISDICREYDLWFHVDGAYGGFAAVLPNASENLKALRLADSVAVDPHKWLYAPLEVGCALLRNPEALKDAFSYHPPYYRFEGSEGDEPTNYYEQGFQNSRGFRALKVWLGLRQAGREGYIQMISDDIALSEELFTLISTRPDFETFSQGLSITTFRFVPKDLQQIKNQANDYLNQLNTEILTRLQSGGTAFLSNAVINGTFLLRACIVNFRTTRAHIQALPEIIVNVGNKVDGEIRPSALMTNVPR